jgi:hypothetical protein
MGRPGRKKTPPHDDMLALQASSASITTAAVTIRTLRLNDRQLTQSVFRQLPRRELINAETLELLGMVWGWVNYDPDASPKNRQFVVQFGETLGRCPFWVRDVTLRNADEWPAILERYGSDYGSAAENYILASALNGSLDFKRRYEINREHNVYGFRLSGRPFFGEHGVAVGHGRNLDMGVQQRLSGIFMAETTRWLHPPGKAPVSEPIPQREIEERASKCTEELRTVLKRRTPNWEKPPEWWDKELDTLAVAAEHYASRWNALMARLRTVEQLYIAA